MPFLFKRTRLLPKSIGFAYLFDAIKDHPIGSRQFVLTLVPGTVAVGVGTVSHELRLTGMTDDDDHKSTQ
jgi:hypothetical protein